MSKKYAVYAGGFKPPHKGHFSVVEKTIQQNPDIDEFVILIGTKERDGITPEISKEIWQMYKSLVGIPVHLKISSSPIGDVYKLAKEFTDDELIFAIGAREGVDQDDKDIMARTKSIDKYSNIKVNIVKGEDKSVSGTNSRKSVREDNKDLFFTYLPTKLKPEYKEKIWDMLTPIIKESLIIKNPTQDHKHYISLFNDYITSRDMNVTPLPELKCVEDETESKNFFGKTAYYDPQNKLIVLYIKGRHPKDIVRSYSHELIHHLQNLEGRLENISTTNTTEDENLEKIEREAYEEGNIIFRNWTDSISEKSMNEIQTPAEEDKVDPQELKIGIEVEMEHTDDREESKKIALQHLAEDPEYYTKLKSLNLEKIEITPEIKYWATFYNVYKDLKENPGKHQEILSQLEGDELDAGKYFSDILQKGELDESRKKDPFGLNEFAHEFAKSVRESIPTDNKKPKYDIFLDLDGVLADFDTHFQTISGGIPPTEYESTYGKSKFWDLIGEHGSEWWVNIPWMKDGDELYNYVKKYKPQILTTPSRSQDSRLGKEQWAKNHTSGVRVNFSFDKGEFAMPGNSILIDDKEKNIKSFENAGGIGILHKNTKNTINQLQILGL